MYTIKEQLVQKQKNKTKQQQQKKNIGPINFDISLPDFSTKAFCGDTVALESIYTNIITN